MKILFLTSGSINSNFTYRALTLATELNKIGHDVAVVSPRADKYNKFTSEKIHEIDGVRILQPFQFATKRLEINLIPYIFSAARIVLREKPDLVYLYKPTPISIVGLLAKFIRRTPVVLDMDDLGSEVMKIEGHPLYQRILVEWCERVAAKYANRLVVASSFLREMYVQKFPNKQVLLLPNGVGLDWFDPVTPTKYKHRVVFMGSINRRNIIEPLFEILPEVIKKYPDTRLLLIGDGQYLNYFKRLTKELNIEKYVEFTGWLTLAESHACLQAGDIGYNYMPDERTVRAASSMKAPQYMARGVLPLVSDVGDMPYTVDYGRAGYIAKADDKNALRECLIQAFGDVERPHKAQYARKYSQLRFEWRKLAKDFNKWLTQPKQTESTDKRVFVITTDTPGDVGGAPIRNFQLIKQLANTPNISVELFCTTTEDDISKVKHKLEKELPITVHVFQKKPSSFRSTLKALVINHMQPFMVEYEQSKIGNAVRAACESSLPTVIQIEQTDAYFCILPHIKWLKSHGVKVIYDAHNIELEAFKGAIRTFKLPKKIVGYCLVPSFKHLEISAVTSSDVVFACSVNDVNYFKNMRNDGSVYLVPNGVDSKHFSPTKKDSNISNILFIGGVQYPANSDALDFYLKEVHPLVRAQMPRVQLLAIGASSEWGFEHGFSNDKTFVPLGFVSDIKPYLDRATIGVCPMREGSGTRLKVLTYMSAALPIVSTTKGAEGILYQSGEEMFVADTPAKFSTSLLYLLSNRAERIRMGQSGRERVLSTYDWDIVGQRLRSYYKEIT